MPFVITRYQSRRIPFVPIHLLSYPWSSPSEVLLLHLAKGGSRYLSSERIVFRPVVPVTVVCNGRMKRGLTWVSCLLLHLFL